MIVLSVDSSGPTASVALARDDKILYEASASLGLTHSQTLQPMVEQAMNAVGLEPEEIDLFACIGGPGSFTGVRIGVCAVKAMAQAWHKPCVALDALEVLAVGQFGFDGVICPILDARRGQVYASAFRFTQGERPLRLMDGVAMALEEYVQLLPKEEKLLFVGDGVTPLGGQVKELLGERAILCPDHRCQIRSGAACWLARRASSVSPYELEPIYFRKPQAVREREARLGGQQNG